MIGKGGGGRGGDCSNDGDDANSEGDEEGGNSGAYGNVLIVMVVGGLDEGE